MGKELKAKDLFSLKRGLFVGVFTDEDEEAQSILFAELNIRESLPVVNTFFGEKNMVTVTSKQRSYFKRILRKKKMYYGVQHICKEWQDPEQFVQWAVEHYQEGSCLWRYDRTQPFSKENCVFLSRSSLGGQTFPKGKVFVTCWGETKSLHEWCRDPRVSLETSSLCSRFYRMCEQLGSVYMPWHICHMLTHPLSERIKMDYTLVTKEDYPDSVSVLSDVSHDEESHDEESHDEEFHDEDCSWVRIQGFWAEIGKDHHGSLQFLRFLNNAGREVRLKLTLEEEGLTPLALEYQKRLKKAKRFGWKDRFIACSLALFCLEQHKDHLWSYIYHTAREYITSALQWIEEGVMDDVHAEKCVSYSEVLQCLHQTYYNKVARVGSPYVVYKKAAASIKACVMALGWSLPEEVLGRIRKRLPDTVRLFEEHLGT